VRRYGPRYWVGGVACTAIALAGCNPETAPPATSTTTPTTTGATTAPPATTSLTTTAPVSTRPTTAPPAPGKAAPGKAAPGKAAPGGSVYYPNCTAARAAGAAPIRRGEPGYRSGLDRDKDGVACEQSEANPPAAGTAPRPTTDAPTTTAPTTTRAATTAAVGGA